MERATLKLPNVVSSKGEILGEAKGNRSSPRSFKCLITIPEGRSPTVWGSQVRLLKQILLIRSHNVGHYLFFPLFSGSYLCKENGRETDFSRSWKLRKRIPFLTTTINLKNIRQIWAIYLFTCSLNYTQLLFFSILLCPGPNYRLESYFSPFLSDLSTVCLERVSLIFPFIISFVSATYNPRHYRKTLFIVILAIGDIQERERERKEKIIV